MSAAIPGVEATLNTVRSALLALHNPAADAKAVLQSQAALTQVKDALLPADALKLAARLLQPLYAGSPTALAPLDAPTVHFGFHIVEERVLLPDPWAAASQQDHADVRALSLLLFSAVGKPHARSLLPEWTRQKSAALLAAVAIREWPQHWPDFVETVAKAADENLAYALACDVFRVISEDVHEYGDRIDAIRKRELSKALSICLAFLLGFLGKVTSTSFAAGDLDTLTSCLNSLKAVASWCDLETLLGSGLCETCMGMLTSPASRGLALEVLTAVAERKFPAHQVVPLGSTAQMVRRVLFENVMQFVASSSLSHVVGETFLPSRDGRRRSEGTEATPTHVDPELHDFHIRFVEMCATLGLTHYGLCFLPFSLSGEDVFPATAKALGLAYFEFMLACAAHPSVGLRKGALRFLSRAFVPPRAARQCIANTNTSLKKKKTAAQPPHGSADAANSTTTGKEMLSEMVNGFLHASLLSLCLWVPMLQSSKYKEAEYDGDEEERDRALADCRVQIITGTIGAAGCLPSQAVHVSLERLTDLLQTTSVVSNSQLESVSPVSIDLVRSLVAPTQAHAYAWRFSVTLPASQAVVQRVLEAALIQTDTCLQAERSCGGQASDRTRWQLSSVFGLVASPKFPLALAAQQIQAMRLFVPLFSEHDASLMTALNILVGFLRQPTTPQAYRVRACSEIADICRRVRRVTPEKLNLCREPLCELAVNGIRSEDLSSFAKGQLLEAAVTSIVLLKTGDGAATMLETLLTPLLTSSEAVVLVAGGSFSTPERLVHFLEHADQATRSSLFSALYLVQVSVHHAVREFASGAESLTPLSPLCRSLAARIVCISVRIVCLLHALYNPTKFPGARTEAQAGRLALTSREIAELLRIDGVSNLTSIDSPDNARSAGDLTESDKADDVLARLGLVVSSPQHRDTREYLRLLRCGAYELVRCGILGGITFQHDHVLQTFGAIAQDIEHMEPLHLYYIVQRILRFALSHNVMASCAAYSTAVLQSPHILAIVQRITEQVDMIPISQAMPGDEPTLDFSRDHSRLRLCRASADMVVAALPRPQRHPPPADSVQPMNNDAWAIPMLLSDLQNPICQCLWNLTHKLCSPEVFTIEGGASARILCAATVRMVEHADEGTCAVFLSLLTLLVQTLAQTESLEQDNAFVVDALVAIHQKYPQRSLEALRSWSSTHGEAVRGGVETHLAAISTANVDSQDKWRKQARAAYRGFAQFCAENMAGNRKKPKTVRRLALPLVAVNAARDAARKANESDVLLAEAALDSLFGDGEPI